jgi:hypothetical protein
MNDEESSLQKAQRDLYWGMYVDLRTHARHAETLRASAVGLALVLLSALVAIIVSDKSIDHADLVLAVGAVVVPAAALVFALSYTELYERNRLRAALIRTTLDLKYFKGEEPSTSSLLKTADQIHHKARIYRASRARFGSAKWFWLTIPVLMLAVGLLILMFAATTPTEPTVAQPTPAPSKS